MEDQIRKIEIELNNLEIKQWVSKIADVQMNAAMGDYEGAEIYLTLAPGISKSNLLPVHIVSLSCLVKQLQSCGCKCGRIRGEKNLLSYLRDDLHLSDYFSSSVVHVEGESDYNLNLWKVSQPHSLMYSQYVSDYLRRKYFIDKDLSMLQVVLDELYSNIADHSKSEGIAYSFINYDMDKNVIRIAFCDFGIGIKESLKMGGADINSEYIKFATQKGVSARSNTHNRGFGLDTVISAVCNSGNIVRILSGNELLVSSGIETIQRTWILNYDFKGTLIYFDISVSSFEEIEYLDNFEF